MNNEIPFSSNVSDIDRVAEIRRQRRDIGANSAISVALAIVLVVLINLIAALRHCQLPIASRFEGGISDNTKELLGRVNADITIISLLESGNQMYASVDELLQSFKEAALDLPNLDINYKTIDPNRDVVSATNLSREFGATPNSIVVIYDKSKYRVITPDELVGRSSVQAESLGVVDFHGEAAVASAIWNVTSSGKRPVICFLSGHGEYSPDDFDKINGYSTVAQQLRKDRYDVRTLDLSKDNQIPDDCDVLVIAGPRLIIEPRQLVKISTYMTRGGSTLIMLDSTSDESLGGLLSEWGVTVRQQSAPNENPTTGTRSAIADPRHQITRAISKSKLIFMAPCIFTIKPDAQDPEELHRPRAVSIAKASPSALESRTPTEIVAVAVERGSRGRSTDGFRSRLVAVGDSQYAANAMIQGGYSANLDFFVSSINWLLEQDVPLKKSNVPFRSLRPGITTRNEWLVAIGIIVLAWPLALWLIGVTVTARRRYRD